MRIIFKILLILNCVTIYSQDYYPDSIWQSKNAGELGMDKVILDSAVYLAVHSENSIDHDLRKANLNAYSNEPNYKILGPIEDRGEPNGLIIKNGYIVAQWGDVNRVDMTFSVSKSFLSTIAIIALDDSLIFSLNDKVNLYLRDDSFQGEHNSKITWEQLLNQTSDWSGCLFDIWDWADRPPKVGTIEDWKKRKLLEPGTQFEYNDVRVNLLAYSLLRVHKQPLPLVLQNKIMNPIGTTSSWKWYGYENSFVNIGGSKIQSVSGGGHFGGGLFINSIDQARYGLLFLRKGKWKTQQLISEEWVLKSHQPSKANKSYGYLWWLNTEKRFKSLPESAYFASGFGGNYIIVDSEHDLVIVYRWMSPEKMDEFLGLVIKSIHQ